MRIVTRFLVALAAACALSASLISSPQINAAPLASNAFQTTFTSVKVTTGYMSAATCAALKTQFPKDAANPRLCMWTHVERSTFVPAKRQPVRTAGSNSPVCILGTRNFDDKYTSSLEFQMEMYTHWSWEVNCQIPVLTSEDCVVNWSNGVVLENRVCTSYTTDVPSRAALQQAWEQWPLNVGNEVFQRRECYVDINSCNWHTDQG